jgi:hypothetical protein
LAVFEADVLGCLVRNWSAAINALRLAKDSFLNAFMLHGGIDIGASSEYALISGGLVEGSGLGATFGMGLVAPFFRRKGATKPHSDEPLCSAYLYQKVAKLQLSIRASALKFSAAGLPSPCS